MHLLDFLFPPRADEACIRDLSVDAFLTALDLVLVEKTRPEAVALLPFADERVRATIHEAKYHGSRHAFTLLAAALAEYVRDANENFRSPIIVPIPLGKARHKERGYNQAEEVALRAGKELGIPVENLLERTRETVSQVSLSREARAENMRGAFTLSPSKGSALSASHTYILLDDVTTTSATLQAAIDALRAAGAEHIIPIALAH